MNNKKKFITPEADLVIFTNEDIIVTSAGTDAQWGNAGETIDTQIP